MTNTSGTMHSRPVQTSILTNDHLLSIICSQHLLSSSCCCCYYNPSRYLPYKSTKTHGSAQFKLSRLHAASPSSPRTNKVRRHVGESTYNYQLSSNVMNQIKNGQTRLHQRQARAKSLQTRNRPSACHQQDTFAIAPLADARLRVRGSMVYPTCFDICYSRCLFFQNCSYLT
ncbi:hypothetical protein BO85DRAFT_184168 [Aspergillus piperis CBS 112811]|uniref:Uncharacterized protein n=1 Tax=Aspergillus piperis CBS 112811 TaxID=1448313 RepID=A0A8G1VQQ6_9EURO|nr:hypothetical protein BO85DRAFT_184168 [Aspergillus piperis CBS 112811]RAH60997.1 hypothetical protein BO85DRAFT_184168 [Aspergillus piperis CBS 112811]